MKKNNQEEGRFDSVGDYLYTSEKASKEKVEIFSRKKKEVGFVDGNRFTFSQVRIRFVKEETKKIEKQSKMVFNGYGKKPKSNKKM